jgi:hypothetical protein
LKKSQKQQQRGRGPFGQIYQGQRFPGQQQLQDGRGIGSFLGTIARGVANLIERTPKWVKSGAKIVGKSTLQGLSDYAGDIQAGVPSDVARKRAFRSTLGTMLEQGGQKLKQEGGRGGGGKRVKRQGKKKHQTGGACCKLKRLRKRSSRTQTGGKKHRSRVSTSRKRRSSSVKNRNRKKKKKQAIKRRAKFDLFSV